MTQSSARYFTAAELATVRSNFQAVLGTHGQGPDAMADHLQVKWRYSGAAAAGQGCDDDPDMTSYLIQSQRTTANDPWEADLVVCPAAFNEPSPPSLTSVINADCQSLKDRATLDMEAPAAAILHELMHWNEVTERFGRQHIGDWNSNPHNANAYPLGGYGAFQASELNRVHPDSGSLNADNYVYFALESFFVQRCPPVTDAEGRQHVKVFDVPQPADWPYETHADDQQGPPGRRG